jgi:hypothetical protein
MGVIRTLFNGILFIILLGLIATGVFFGYQYYLQNLPSNYGYVNASIDVSQFAHYLRFEDSQISYFINSNCNAERTARMLEAFKILADSVPEISFYASNEKKANILVGCSKDSYQQEENIFIAGEGGPTAYLNLSYYPLIKKGKVILYQKSECEYPVVELHELLHVLGFNHVNNKTNIMFPYAVCEARLDSETIKILSEIYSIEPVAELYFVNASAKAFNGYLNISISITNQGLKGAEKLNILLIADTEELEPIDMDAINPGETQMLGVSNIRLSKREISVLEIRINYTGKEFDKANNIAIIELKNTR